MQSEHDFSLELDSDCFQRFCEQLNLTVKQESPTWSVDMMSGGFKFSDEVTEQLMQAIELRPTLVGLLRQLWGYRVSLVRGKPRADLAECWESTKALAPNWVGFSEERCSSEAIALAQECTARYEVFAKECDAWDARINEQLRKRQAE